MAESRFEGIHAYQDRVREGMAYLESPETQQKIMQAAYNDLIQSGQPFTEENLYARIEKRMAEAKASIENNARTVANATALANYPILMASNLILFSKVLGGSYGVQKGVMSRFKDASKAFGTGDAGSTSVAGANRLTGAIKPGGKMVTEGMSKGAKLRRYG